MNPFQVWKAIVLFPFEAQNEDELSVTENEDIDVMVKAGASFIAGKWPKKIFPQQNKSKRRIVKGEDKSKEYSAL